MALLRAFPALTQDVQCCKENINDQDRFWSEALWALGSEPAHACTQQRGVTGHL